MSRLSKLAGKPKEYEIEGEKFTFKPLKVDNLDLVMDLQSEDKRASSMTQIIKLTLKDAVPDSTDVEIDNIAIQYFKVLSDAILDVNGLDETQAAS